jgi:hypothetical protein
MFRLFPTQVYSETGEKIGTALVIEKLVDPQRNELYFRLKDGRIGRATHGGHGCTIVDPSKLSVLRRTY